MIVASWIGESKLSLSLSTKVQGSQACSTDRNEITERSNALVMECPDFRDKVGLPRITRWRALKTELEKKYIPTTNR